MKTPAFLSPTPLVFNKSTKPQTCPKRSVIHTKAVISPSPPEKEKTGRRSPSFRKLQRRHRLGPTEFRQQQEALEKEQQEQQDQQEEYNLKVHPKHRKRSQDAIQLRDLHVGQQFDGVVQNLVRHGAFVDIGATRDGLVHMRDFDVEFIHIPSDKVQSGDKVKVWVKYVDSVKNVLALSMVEPRTGWHERFPVKDVVKGQKYEGYIARISNFGAYVDIGAERMAFLHIANLWGEDRGDTLNYLRLGFKLWVYVLDVDLQRSHIKLSARGVGGRLLDKEGDVEIKELKAKMPIEQRYGRTAIRRPWDEDKDEEIEDDQIGKRAAAMFVENDPEDLDSIQKKADNEEDEDEEDDEEEEDDEFAFADTDFDPIDGIDTVPDELASVRDMLDNNTEYVGVETSDIWENYQ